MENKNLKNSISTEQAEGLTSLSFFEYMNLVLYAPQVGYYSSNFPKIGNHGDFITAPELTPIFARAIAVQFAEIAEIFEKKLKTKASRNILEFGAGSGKFAIDVLLALQELEIEIENYFILEPSEGLRAQQQEYCSRFKEFKGVGEKISWLTSLPDAQGFSGIIFANEVLDAMPVHRFIKTKNGEILEQSVRVKANGAFLELEYGEPLVPSEELLKSALELESRLGSFPENYCSEINLLARPWLKSLYEILNYGAVLLIDYGYGEAEYYSPFRSSGTLSCYSKHRVHADPLLNPGEQDITAHVDFTQIAESAISLGFELEGYTTQGLFLANLLPFEKNPEKNPESLSPNLSPNLSPEASQHLRRLMHPSAMGGMFKVIGFSKNLEPEEDFTWKGFLGVDQRHRL